MFTWETFVEYYISLRPQIFTGFLTVGSFLLSMKTFIVATMKKEYYQKSGYRDVYRKQRAMDKTIGPYDPLIDLGKLLTTSIVLSYITAFLQISLGYFVGGPERGSVAFTANHISVSIASFNFLMAMLSLGIVVKCIYVIHHNVQDLLALESAEIVDEIDKEEAEQVARKGTSKIPLEDNGCC